jgi:hypothetical protein
LIDSGAAGSATIAQWVAEVVDMAGDTADTFRNARGRQKKQLYRAQAGCG